MTTRKRLTEAAALEQYRVSLENVENQPHIAAIMAEFGFDSTVITQGKEVLATAHTAYTVNQTEDDETTEAYQNFSDLKEQVATAYVLHRKKAKVIFRKDAVTLIKLEIMGYAPRSYVSWLEKVKKFYAVALGDTVIETELTRLKVTSTDLQEAITNIAALQDARAEYLKEKGESQNATKIKDAAFSNLEDWMYEFYAVAKIALDDSPQLLEVLGKLVRS